MSRWFRWYEGTSEDGKFRLVARLSRVTVRDVIALWAFMLEDAAHLDHRGVCHRNEDFMASILDFEDGVVEAVLAAMETAGMISVGAGAITICNWGKRQFESDTDPTAARRQREKRERDRGVSNGHVTRDTGGSDTDTETNTERQVGNFRKVGEVKASGPRHGAVSPSRGTVFVRQGTDDWNAYAEDYRKAFGVEPEPNKDGGFWFKIAGVTPLPEPKRLTS